MQNKWKYFKLDHRNTQRSKIVIAIRYTYTQFEKKIEQGWCTIEFL